MNRSSRLGPVVVLVIVLSAILPGSVARAGDTIVGGDCWKVGTPLICRNVWVDNQMMRVRLIDQMNSAPLHAKADVARNNWTLAVGPQILSFAPAANDTWIYLKRDDSMGVPNGKTFNCNNALGASVQ